MGIFLSVGHRSLTADNLELFETIKQTPIEWVLTKTASDDPEGFLKLTQRIGELKGSKRDEVGLATTMNLKKVIELETPFFCFARELMVLMKQLKFSVRES